MSWTPYKQYLSYRKNKGQEKPFTECEDCLYIKDKCKLCEEADMFFDRGNVMYDTIKEVFIENGVTRGNRLTTQRRDGCHF